MLLPSEQGGLLAGLTAPLGFLWLFLAFLKRGTDVERHTEALQSELRKLSYPLTDAEAKTMRIADALRRQVDVLNAASDSAQEQLEQTGAALEAQAKRIRARRSLAGKVAPPARPAAETRNIDERIAGVGKALRGHVADLEIQLADAGPAAGRPGEQFCQPGRSRAPGTWPIPPRNWRLLGDKLAAQPAAFAKSAREQGAAIIAAFDAAGERFAKTTDGPKPDRERGLRCRGPALRREHARPGRRAGRVPPAGRRTSWRRQLRGKAEAMNALFDRLVEQGQRAQDAVQAHLSDLTQAGEEAEAMGAALRANLQDNVAAIRDSAAESADAAKDLGGMLEQRAADLARTIETRAGIWARR